MSKPGGELSTEDRRLLKVETVLWGPFGDNGVKGDVARHGEQIGELFSRGEILREQLYEKLDGLYRLMATLIVTILVGAGGIIATLVVTK